MSGTPRASDHGDYCVVEHRVLGRCVGAPGHPNIEGRPPSISHGSALGSWDVRESYSHWNFWALTCGDDGLSGGDDYPDGVRRIERFTDPEHPRFIERTVFLLNGEVVSVDEFGRVPA